MTEDAGTPRERATPVPLFVAPPVPAEADDAEPLTISEAAIVCGVERKTLERHLRQGDFPNAFRAPRDPEGSSFQSVWRIPIADLRAAGLEVNLAKLPPRKPPL